MTPPAAASRRTILWIVAGMVVLLLLGVAGVITLVALDAGGGSEPDAAQPPTSTPTPSIDEFGPVPEICEETEHFAPVFDVYPLEAVDRDSESDDSLYQRDCIFALAGESALGQLTVLIRMHDEQEDARNDYRGAAKAAEDFNETREEFAGDWDKGLLVTTPEGAGGQVQLVVTDGVLVLDIASFIAGDNAYDLEAHQAALAQVADNVREAMRQ